MDLIKKLIFVPLFLISLISLIYLLTPLLISYDLIFSLSVGSLIQLAIIAGLFSLTGLLFALFITLASDWKIALPVTILASLIPMVFIPPALALVFAVSVFVSLLLTNLNLDTSLKSYLTFQPSSILGPSIRHLSGLLILSFCIIFFLQSGKTISQNGFQIPEPLIDTALKFIPSPQPSDSQDTQDNTLQSLPKLSKEDLETLKQNPEALKQYGLDPKILDQIQLPAEGDETVNTTAMVKPLLKEQFQNFIKPYINFIPAILAVLLFLTFQALTSFINILLYPLLWVIFFILEKTGIIKFEIEQRPVKKLVV